MFRSPAALAAWTPRFVRHGLEVLQCRDVMKFLGRPVPASGGVHGRFAGEVVTDFKDRPEGVRLLHRLNGNAIKMYDKQASVLRIETTINDARDIKVDRTVETAPDGPKKWLRLRKAVADLPRRTQVSQHANERYLESLATVEEDRTLGELTTKLCRPAKWKGRSARALNPLSTNDLALLRAVSQGEFLQNGFRNRDLRPLLGYKETADSAEQRRHSAAVTRQLRLLRAHHLIRKVPKTHRYQLTDNGRTAIAAILSAQQTPTKALQAA